MARYANHPEALAEAGVAYATEQIVDLLAAGVDGIHLYTMNRPETTRRIASQPWSSATAIHNRRTILESCGRKRGRSMRKTGVAGSIAGCGRLRC